MPGFERTMVGLIQGARTVEFHDTVPQTSKAGGNIDINFPSLMDGEFVVPGSVYLTGEITVSGTKTSIKNNLGRQLVKRIQVQTSGRGILDLSDYNIIMTYNDLWKSWTERQRLKREGIQEPNVRKIIAGDDSRANNAQDNLIAGVLGNRFRIPLDVVLGNNGAYIDSNDRLMHSIQFASNEDVLVAQAGEDLGTYELTKMRLEFEKVLSPDRSADAYRAMLNRELYVQDIFRTKTFLTQPADTGIDLQFNITREALKCVVIVFKKTQGDTDSEEYPYPNIESVKINANGVSSYIYPRNEGLGSQQLYSEAERVFGGTDLHRGMTWRNFFTKHFALVIDLRSIPDKALIATGKNMPGNSGDVNLEIKKKAHTGVLRGYVYLISDLVATYEDGFLTEILR